MLITPHLLNSIAKNLPNEEPENNEDWSKKQYLFLLFLLVLGNLSGLYIIYNNPDFHWYMPILLLAAFVAAFVDLALLIFCIKYSFDWIWEKLK